MMCLRVDILGFSWPTFVGYSTSDNSVFRTLAVLFWSALFVCYSEAALKTLVICHIAVQLSDLLAW